MISIVTVNFNAYDFLELLIESLAWYSRLPYELVVIDNSIKQQQISRPSVFQHFMPHNIGHGTGLNYGVKHSQFPFIMFLDVDAHILCHDWEKPFLEQMERFDVIAGRGVPAKPIRPACMFMKREFSNYDWRDSEGYKGHRVTPEGTDVAIKAYYNMLKDEVKLGFLESKGNRYGTYTGEEWCINDKPLVYHHWHGAHLTERQVDFPDVDLMAEKDRLFKSVPWRLL